MRKRAFFLMDFEVETVATLPPGTRLAAGPATGTGASVAKILPDK